MSGWPSGLRRQTQAPASQARDFWSPTGGVGSNPTSDMTFSLLLLRSNSAISGTEFLGLSHNHFLALLNLTLSPHYHCDLDVFPLRPPPPACLPSLLFFSSPLDKNYVFMNMYME